MCDVNMSQCEYNKMVLDQIDTKGTEHDDSCPSCGKPAGTREFESCHTGSVNQHYTINCKHCGYHECDLDDGCCPVCEHIEYKTPIGFDESAKANLVFDSLMDSLSSKGTMNAVDWSYLKHYVFKIPELVGFYSDFYISDHNQLKGYTPKHLIAYMQKEILDIRFKYRIDKKIEAALAE
jgi:hypothetical protein